MDKAENPGDNLLDLAFRRHAAGRSSEAENLCLQIPEGDPDQPVALHLLGVIAHQAGRGERAVDLIKKALALAPDYAEAHNNLASVLIKLDRPEEACASYRKAIAIKPDYADAHNSLATALVGLGRTEEAVVLYRKALAIKPDYTEANNNLGNALRDLRRPEEAVACYRKALAIKPDYAQAHNNLGNAYHDLERSDEAVASYRKALSINPDYAEAHYNLGKAFKYQGKLDDAVASYYSALAINPDYAEAYNNLGNILLDLRKIDDAAASFRKALAIKPDFAEAHSNLGNALKALGRTQEAVASHQQALAFNPDSAEAHCNSGVAFKDQGKLDEAMASYRRAIAIAPDYAQAHYNLSLAQLLLGDFENGWKNYAWRWKLDEFSKIRRPYSCPLWDGGDFDGKTLFLYPEQGLGDFIQFVRLARLARARGGRVILEAPAALYNLMSSFEGVDTVIQTGQPPGEFDLHAAILDLPGLLGTTLETVPSSQDTIGVTPELGKKWAARLAAYDGLRVGLVWAGDPDHKNDKNRSIDPQLMKPLLQVAAAQFFSLQVGRDGEAAETLGPQVIDLGPELTSFGETAAAMMNLDIIISIDSAPAHLAGALGRTAWTLLPFMPDWRWLLGRDDSPWYPSMALFRQDKAGDWESVIERVCRQLSSQSTGG